MLQQNARDIFGRCSDNECGGMHQPHKSCRAPIHPHSQQHSRIKYILVAYFEEDRVQRDVKDSVMVMGEG